jgi:hypothetical protein
MFGSEAPRLFRIMLGEAVSMPARMDVRCEPDRELKCHIFASPQFASQDDGDRLFGGGVLLGLNARRL